MCEDLEEWLSESKTPWGLPSSRCVDGGTGMSRHENFVRSVLVKPLTCPYAALPCVQNEEQQMPYVYISNKFTSLSCLCSKFFMTFIDCC